MPQYSNHVKQKGREPFKKLAKRSQKGSVPKKGNLKGAEKYQSLLLVYPEHDMPGEFPVSLSHNLLDVTTEDIKQFVAIQALKHMSGFQEDVAIESDGETLEDSDD